MPKKNNVTKTQSIVDDIVFMTMNFLKKYWWIVVILFLSGGIALSDIKCETSGGNKFEKGAVDLNQLKQ